MNDAIASRPPYGAAAGAAALIFAGYLATLAPTVTFWDAGEFIAAAKILGIPHPPGTPLFVMIAHVWGKLVPLGEFAFRTNMLSALLSAAAAGFFFLVAHETIRGFTAALDDAAARLVRVGGAAVAAIIGAFSFTNWQNSVETEVYSVSTCSIAAICWLAHIWRRQRGTERAPRTLLLIVYLAGLSIGNHLLTLLAGPAVVLFLASALWRRPDRESGRSRAEWAHVAVVAGLWALLIGTGLGSTSLMILGAICFAAAAAFAVTAGAGGFAVLALAVASVGVTPYLYLYLRSAQNPMINEAAPATFDALLAVIRREQYPVRTPLDDPTVFHGPDNPGRTLTIFWLQLQNYLQYFGWQWAKSLGAKAMVPLHIAVTLLFLVLGIQGSLAQRRADRDAWWLLCALFLVTGLGLVVYMNFKPGYSVGFELYPSPADHEVRERDYFFVVSFIVWGVWAGIGLAAIATRLLGRWSVPAPARHAVTVALLAVGLLPVALNWTEASRRHGAATTLAADFAYDLLNTVPPYGILFTYGDNDTFPLWWAQEVGGIRRDVTVICLALANTDWYMRQLRDNPLRDFDASAAPAPWRSWPASKPDWPLHTMSNEEIASNAYSQALPQDVPIVMGPITHTYPARTIFTPSDVLSVRVLQQNAGRRPIVWAITAGREFAGLGKHVVQQGLGFRLDPARGDTTKARDPAERADGTPLDVPLTQRLAWNTYRYGGLLDDGEPEPALEPTSAGIAASLSIPFTQLAYAFDVRGDTAKVIRNLERAQEIAPHPAIAAALTELRTRVRAAGSPSVSDEAGR